jgi:hypothetical protein
LFTAVSIAKFILVVVWQTARHRLRDFFDSAPLVCTVSKRAAASKQVTPCDSNFEEEVLGYLQEGLSGVESESDCAI